MSLRSTRFGANIGAGLEQALDHARESERMLITGACLMLEREVKLQYSKPGLGRVYIRGGVRHRASAPGAPPAPDTGRLRNSVTHEITGEALGKVRGHVGTNVEYAEWLEFGTFRIQPRPAWRPALAIARRQLGSDGSKLFENLRKRGG